MKTLIQRNLAKLLAIAIVAVGSGTAAGQAVLGETSLEVEQALNVATVMVDDGRGGSAIVSPDGTYFVASSRVFPGESYRLQIRLTNESTHRLTALLVAESPKGFTVQADRPAASAGVSTVARLGGNQWLVEVSPTGPQSDGVFHLTITVDVATNTPPGVYNQSFNINTLAAEDWRQLVNR
jgi:hypothetical protein